MTLRSRCVCGWSGRRSRAFGRVCPQCGGDKVTSVREGGDDGLGTQEGPLEACADSQASGDAAGELVHQEADTRSAAKVPRSPSPAEQARAAHNSVRLRVAGEDGPDWTEILSVVRQRGERLGWLARRAVRAGLCSRQAVYAGAAGKRQNTPQLRRELLQLAKEDL